MAKRENDLLAEIERDALDESKSVAAALRKCLVLGGHAGSTALREWATRELKGYPSREDELPDYRRIRAPLLLDGLNGNYKVTAQSISVLDLPKIAHDVVEDEVPLSYGIGEIEALIRQADTRGGFLELGPPGGAELARLMTHEIGDPSRYVERLYWSVSAASLRGVVDAVRTSLIELVAELRAGMAPGEHAPSPELAEQALQVAVHGNKNRITLSSAIADHGGTATAMPTSGEGDEPGFWTTSRRIGALVVGLAAIVTAVAAVLGLHPKL
jgi:AbiTii